MLHDDATVAGVKWLFKPFRLQVSAACMKQAACMGPSLQVECAATYEAIAESIHDNVLYKILKPKVVELMHDPAACH